MAPSSRFKKDAREKREVTPFQEDPAVEVAPPEIPAEWRDIEAPVNFTWVVQDELAGMGWPKSRDQVNFCVKQGIDHLITLAADKIPPHYAFPQIKWTIIPVEDFTGPTINDIKKFISIMAEARRDGEAVGVHCAEGRGRTGVICACYLIYYYDMEPWDAIRIMRRQRPGSVERKVQEETVVMFYDLLNDWGSLDNLEEKEKEWKRMRQQQQLKNDLLICPYTALYNVNKLSSMATARDQKRERMRRSRSMPKMNDEIDEAIKEETRFHEHIRNFYCESPKRKTSRERSRPPLDKYQKEEENEQIRDPRFDRGTTPGRVTINLQPKLKPAPRKSDVVDINNEPKHDLRLHFKDFMSTNSNSCKRARSFSQPRDKQREGSEVRRTSRNLEESVEEQKDGTDKRKSGAYLEAVEKGVADRVQSEKTPLTTSEVINNHDDEIDDNNKDKPVLDEPDNRETEDNISDCSSLTSSRRVSRNDSMASISEISSNSNKTQVPPQPKYKPASIQDSGSSTSSYYARIRDRAEVTRRREVKIEPELSSAPNSCTMARKFETNIYRRTDRKQPDRQRSKTTEIDYVSPTTTPKSSSSEGTSALSESTASSNVTIMTTSDEAADHEVENIMDKPQNSTKSVIITPPISPTSPTKNVSGKKLESRTSSDSLKVENNSTEKKGRLSPFNRFRTSLVSGTASNSSPNSISSPRKSSPAASMLGGQSGTGRQRTESTSSAGGCDKPEKRRFFYRKSRTGPLDETQGSTTSPASSSTSNSASNLTSNEQQQSLASEAEQPPLNQSSRSQKLSNSSTDHPALQRVRAKSEFNPRTAEASTSTSDYGGLVKDNYFLAAAKKWASYDKPSYDTTFSRTNWKRSHRKFNYSRFLNYTRETFV